MKFRGSFTPIVTPFNRKGRVDAPALEKFVEWLISQGSDGIVCCATTGEGPCLSDADRKKIGEICIRTAAGRVSVIAATGVSDTKSSVRYTESALKLGADGCLAVTPYYNRPSQQGCILHFSEMAKVGLPIIVYHNPPRAAIRLTAETIIALSRIPNIIAIKESSHDLNLIRQITKQIDVFAGDDDLAFEILKLGAVGTISTSSNLIPRGWKKMVALCLEKKWDQAEELAARYLPLIRALFLETNPQGIKFALSWIGKCKPILRLPMMLPQLETQKEIEKAILRLSLPHFDQVPALES